MVRGLGMALLAALPLAACSGGEDELAARSGGWSIAAGTYSNVSAENGGLVLTLAQGDQSATGAFLRCDPSCGEAAEVAEAADVALRRGLNGVSFSVSEQGRMVDVTVTPASPNSVSLSADWGAGLETVELPLKP